jgi:hypothetical protein
MNGYQGTRVKEILLEEKNICPQKSICCGFSINYDNGFHPRVTIFSFVEWMI